MEGHVRLMSDKETREREENLIRIFLGDSRRSEGSFIRYIQRSESSLIEHIMSLLRPGRLESYSWLQSGIYYLNAEHLWLNRFRRAFYGSHDSILRELDKDVSPISGLAFSPDSSAEAREETGSLIFDIFFSTYMHEMEDTLRRMQRDQEDIERLKNETRDIMAKLQAS